LAVLLALHQGCGWWTLKMKNWDVIDPDELNPWMADFVTIRVPNGESFTDLHSCCRFYTK
jgi:hypothetical protein